jgi:hypothetical protein
MDQFRGLTILGMSAVHYASGFNWGGGGLLDHLLAQQFLSECPRAGRAEDLSAFERLGGGRIRCARNRRMNVALELMQASLECISPTPAKKAWGLILSESTFLGVLPAAFLAYSPLARYLRRAR